MRGVNKVILIGTLGSDPDVKTTQNGVAISNLSIATSESWQDQQGNKQERTEWHRVVLYRRLAEVAGQHLKKGGKVYIEGRLQTRKWQDKEGNDRYTTEILGDSLQMLGDKPQNAQNAQNNGAGYQAPQYQAQAPQAGQSNEVSYQIQQHPAQAPQAGQNMAQQYQPQYQQQPQPQMAQQYQPQPQGEVTFDDDIPF